MANTWNIEGSYFEACNCDVTCPCTTLSEPTEGECKALVGWHVEQGQFGDVNLDGLNAALAIYTPGHMMEGDWKVALYIDERASDAQQEALTEILGGHAGGHPANLGKMVSQVLGVKRVPMEYKADGRERALRVGDVAHAHIKAIDGHDEGDVTLENHPLAVAPGFTAVVAKSSEAGFDDHGFSWEVSERSGLYSPFHYSG